MKRNKNQEIIRNIIRKLQNQSNRKILIEIGISTILILMVVIVLTCLFINREKSQKYVVYNGKNIKESKYPGYQELIEKLKEEHPNWTFTLFYTHLDWNEVIANEGHSDNRTNPLNLIPDSSKYPEDWKCEIDGDKTFDNGTWLCASNKAIDYQMDPRNILNEEDIFQFKTLEYVENATTLEGMKEITDDTFLAGKEIASVLIEAGKNVNVDPYFIASRLIQEQGRKGTVLSQGYEYQGKTIYNPFNMNASGNSQDEIIENAAKYAYEQGWDTLEKGLLGGVELIKEGYINKGQNTLYLQKFDVVNQDGKLYTNQYMQNLLAPMSEASNMLEVYEASQTVDSNFNFIIPLYENMPKETSEK